MLGLSLDSAASNSVLFTLFSHLFVLVFYIQRTFNFVLHSAFKKKISRPDVDSLFAKTVVLLCRLGLCELDTFSFPVCPLFSVMITFWHPIRDTQQSSNVAFLFLISNLLHEKLFSSFLMLQICFKGLL